MKVTIAISVLREIDKYIEGGEKQPPEREKPECGGGLSFPVGSRGFSIDHVGRFLCDRELVPVLLPEEGRTLRSRALPRMRVQAQVLWPEGAPALTGGEGPRAGFEANAFSGNPARREIERVQGGTGVLKVSPR